jgi:hypothetical protein
VLKVTRRRGKEDQRRICKLKDQDGSSYKDNEAALKMLGGMLKDEEVSSAGEEVNQK